MLPPTKIVVQTFLQGKKLAGGIPAGKNIYTVCVGTVEVERAFK